MSARGTTNTNVRGNAADRRRRKEWLLLTFGDGVTALCTHCGVDLTLTTITVDRIIPGILGGGYTRDNIRPSCLRCNSLDGIRLREELKHGTVSNSTKGRQ